MKSTISLKGWESTRGIKGRTAKLSEEQVRMARSGRLPDSVLAKTWNVCVNTVYLARIRKTYQDVQ